MGQIDVENPNVIKDNLIQSSTSYVFKFDPSTIAFIFVVLHFFKIEKI
jgi:hypothetical protein